MSDMTDMDRKAREILESLPEKMTPRDRMAIPRQDMPSQDPKERIKNMSEVALGYTRAMAVAEANRCLDCRNAPCVTGCPVRIDIPGFIRKVRKEDFEGALGVIQESSILPSICGRVCPQESQCQMHCTVGKAFTSVDKAVAIGWIERFVADTNAEKENIPECGVPTGKKVCVVGSGPASIACAADLRKAGHEVVMYEALHKCGGVLSYGIPEFRLPKKLVDREIEKLERMGVRIEKNFLVGRTRTIDALMKEDGYDAVFIGSGA